MMKARYLTYFSYIGSHFRSSEKLWLKEGSHYPDPESVQGLIELALLKLRSLNYPKITLSSRYWLLLESEFFVFEVYHQGILGIKCCGIDGGVHALNSTAHFDLERLGPDIYETDKISYVLNRTFFKNNTSIFIKNCTRVPDNFNARFQAKSRTYLYRFAVLKKGVQLPHNFMLPSLTPIEEWKRCQFFSIDNFDIEKFKSGSKYFVGYHDFTTFKKYDKATAHKHNRRELLSVEVRRGGRLVTSYRRGEEDVFDYWEMEIRGRGFVHNQIRRMVGALISVAIGKLPEKELKVMLQVPCKHSWPSFLQVVPPDGLYLCNVEYDPQDLIYEPDCDPKDTKSIADAADVYEAA